MSTAATSPPYLPPAGQVAWVEIDGRWSAVSPPGTWGALVLDALADGTGPILEDPAGFRLIWPLPSGGGADWPDGSGGGGVRHDIGDGFLIPGPGGFHPGSRWVRHPDAHGGFTDPGTLYYGVTHR
ncbi:hypothetical protein [Streptomyces sp. NPDC047097]|uniref:hypothetical protein n=1 Tax=Streptomyces sp. NPDC047097 TaxID=3155260 RepID=UPI00340DD806